MRLEENVAVGVGIAVAAGFLIWFLLAAFVSTSIGGGIIPGASSVSPTSGGPAVPPPGTTTVVKLPNGKTATVTIPAITTTGP